MHATIRRYESIDQSRTSELVKQCEESLVPALRELPGFNGYSLVDSGNGVMTSVGLFNTAAQAEESTRVAGSWLREHKLETALPNPPKITSGTVAAVHTTRELVQAQHLRAGQWHGEGPHARVFSAPMRPGSQCRAS